MDDRLGRRIAAERGLPVIGTMTVLLRAKQHGLLPAFAAALPRRQRQIDRPRQPPRHQRRPVGDVVIGEGVALILS
ncbi:MAG: hypothetical protein RMK84_07645 [Oscillochloridaceae bacterium]|nr:hypothetical protein [Oscillochloridaceae bacterium]